MEPTVGQYACIDIKGLKHFGIRFPNVMGWLIKVFTNSKYNHAFVYIGDGNIVEAQPSGAKVSKLTEYMSTDPVIWSSTPMTPDQVQRIIEASHSCVGLGYGFLDILYIGMARIGFKQQWLLNRVLDENKMICSQLVAFAGKEAGITSWLCGQEYAQEVTPGELATAAGVKGKLW